MPVRVKFFVIIFVIILLGCQTELPVPPNVNSDLKIPTSEPDQQPEEVKLTSNYLKSSLPRQTLLLQSDLQLENFVQANNEFAVAIFQQLRSENPDQNMIFSPHSISLALAMTYAGAGGQTAEEMRTILGINQDDLYLPSKLEYPRSMVIDQNKRNSGEFTGLSAQIDECCLGTTKLPV